MLVKVVKCSNIGWWYSDSEYIGRVFEVTKSVEFSDDYCILASVKNSIDGDGFYLAMKDCVVVDKPRPMNSVINYTRRVRCL